MAGAEADTARAESRPTTDSERRTRRLIDAALAAGGVMTILTFVQYAVIGGRPRSGTWESAGQSLVWFALVLSAGVIGSVLVRRQPDNGLARWLAAGGVSGCLGPVADQYAALMLEVEPGAAPGGTIALLVSSVALFSSWAILGAHVALRFPTGRLLSARWRWVSRLATASAVLCGIEIFHPDAFDDDEVFIDLAGVSNPIGIPGFAPVARVAFGVGILALFLATFLAVGSLVVRYRRSRGVERDQLRWIVYAAVMTIVTGMATSNLANAVDGMGREVCLLIASVAPLLLMVGLGIAVLRHQLFDIRVVIRRTLLYGSLAAFITLAYIAVVVGLGRIIGAGSSEDLVLSIVATALVAIAFQPARSRLERVANRLVYGNVTSPYDLMAGMSRRIASAMTPDQTLAELAEVTARGLRSRAARVQLFATGAASADEATWSDPALAMGPAPMFPIGRTVIHGGEAIGEISVEPREDDPPGPAELEMLDDLAAHAGVALRNLRLTSELQQKLVELRASRQRLVEAQNEERRRMERDIHDGAQQQLVAIRIKLGLAKILVAEDTDAAVALLSELQAESAEALETLRDLARGLFPPTLAERGLLAALQAHVAKTGLPVTVEDEGPTDLRFDLNAEAAIYFCMREALQNASKHAPGRPVTMRLAVDDGGGELSFSVTDQGPGFDPATVVRGSGLQNMVDRIEALGGTLEFLVGAGTGTSVCGRVPLDDLRPVGADALV
ncbi:MAG TPA: sensor histidine kinase [Acidimicrobiales bacterium]|nr:sensor histidine kinase [Acidimicrobiales bacterium]